MSEKVDWETEIMYHGRPLSDYRDAVIEECARVAEKEIYGVCAAIAIRALKGDKI